MDWTVSGYKNQARPAKLFSIQFFKPQQSRHGSQPYQIIILPSTGQWWWWWPTQISMLSLLAES